ncbi:MAG TPA: phosphate acetyltransferase [Lentisphaeria bacterium]|nr:MAG: phosphate acetyltransferase [Lentisphaerae bacterium GWF2_38_69]HBM15828.1 phosphate acetyltransferase [Lentisphaeria bacterium]
MSIMDKIIEKARAKQKKLVLAEGHDQRVVIAANKIIEKGIAKSVIVIGTEAEISKSCKDAGITERKFTSYDHLTCPKMVEYAKILQQFRAEKKKDITLEKAIETLKQRIFFGAMLLRIGEVDALVAGSIASTADMLRAAFMIIGTTPGIKSASSAFLMDLASPSPGGESTLLYSDGAVIPDPDSATLVDIALATAKTHLSLIGTTPKIAFLSFSTKGSAEHPLIDKVRTATEMCKAKIAELKLDYLVDGELQADAALVPKVAASKAPDSPLAGNANILIFPDLNVGNICYKITQRLAGAAAIGPVLQGLAKPMSDLSRGCSADDIVGTAAMVICQAQ